MRRRILSRRRPRRHERARAWSPRRQSGDPRAGHLLRPHGQRRLRARAALHGVRGVFAMTTEQRTKIDTALAEVEAAEGALAKLLEDLRGAPRAEKVKVTEVIETAFSRLRAAREELARLRDILPP